MKKNKRFTAAFLFAIFIISMRLGAQCTFTSSVPYYQGFQSLTATNQLPTCWTASNLGTTCLTYTTPSQYAAFSYSPAGANYFYTNGIQLYTGVTYSTALFYKTDNTGSLNWTDLSILLGTTQTTVGQSTIASTNGPAANPIYTLLSGTFTVASSGIYYASIRGTGNTSGTSQYLYWDDLSITIPCNSNSPNNPTVTVSANQNSICVGKTVTITASGASTYTWSNGSNGSIISDSPFSNTIYTVTGTNSLTSCTNAATINIQVLPAPVITLPFPKTICHADSVSISATTGPYSVIWNTGSTNTTIVVSPTITSFYTATLSTTAGCTNTTAVLVTVNPQPALSVAAPTVICKGESAVLTASGASSYTWIGSGAIPSTTVSPQSTSTYTLIGIGANGCGKKMSFTLNVDQCTGLTGLISIDNHAEVFPNPTNGNLTLKFGDDSQKSLMIKDITGSLILETTLNGIESNVDIKDLTKGLYFFFIQSNGQSTALKVIKE